VVGLRVDLFRDGGQLLDRQPFLQGFIEQFGRFGFAEKLRMDPYCSKCRYLGGFDPTAAMIGRGRTGKTCFQDLSAQVSIGKSECITTRRSRK
jgi:hypothetical protein